MTQDEIIEMAEQANLDREPPDEYCRVEYWTATFEDLEAYTKLVTEKALADHIADVSKMIAWYDPTNHHVSTDKNDPMFTPLGQLWPLVVQREWVSLTDGDEIDWDGGDLKSLIASVEAKLKEKNNG